MKERIEYWAEEALLDEDNPNNAIKKIAEKYSSELNPDKLQRLVETYNVKSFLNKKERGEDLEESFPVADPTKVASYAIKRSVDKLLPKEASDKITVPFDEAPHDMVKEALIKEALIKKSQDKKKINKVIAIALKNKRPNITNAEIDKVVKALAFNLKEKKKQEENFETYRKGVNTQKAKDRIDANKLLAGITPTIPGTRKLLANELSTDINYIKNILSPSNYVRKPENSFLYKTIGDINTSSKQIATNFVDTIFNPQNIKERAKDYSDKQEFNAKLLVNNYERRALVEKILNSPEFDGTDKETLIRGVKDAYQIAPITLSNAPGLVKRIVTNMAQLGIGLDPSTALELSKLERVNLEITDKIKRNYGDTEFM